MNGWRALILSGYVADLEVGVSTCRFNRSDRFRRVLDVEDLDAGAVRRQSQSCCAPQPGCRARNERHAIAQTTHSSLPSISRVRYRRLPAADGSYRLNQFNPAATRATKVLYFSSSCRSFLNSP